MNPRGTETRRREMQRRKMSKEARKPGKEMD
jgi:hypothetical protein